MLYNRRKFIEESSKALVGTTALAAISGTVLESCQATKSIAQKHFETGFGQSPLGYAYNALEKAIDAATMELHYSKHAAGYSKNLTAAAKEAGINVDEALENVLRKISKYSPAIRNNGGGHYNHELFWKCLSPNSSGTPGKKMLAAITTRFGSFDSFKTSFADAATKIFGSGWAWLIIADDKKLTISTTPNQDNPLMDIATVKGAPLLGIDLWEHAYYLKYQNKRAEYLKNIWNVINWDFIENRFEKFA